MPINTCICPNCGARINQTVKRDDFDIKNGAPSSEEELGVVIVCPRCKVQCRVASYDLSQRTITDIQALEQFDQVMSDDENVRYVLEDDGGDAVEAALSKADKVFDNAKRALDDIHLEDVSDTIDADVLLGKYRIPDVKSFAFTKARNKVVEAGVERGYSEESVGAAYDAAANLLQEHIPESRFSSVLDIFATNDTERM